MRETLKVSSRGQITLPATMRKRVGIREGGAVVIEDRDDEIVLKPAAIFEIEMYSDKQIAEWEEADRMSADEKAAILKRLKRGK